MQFKVFYHTVQDGFDSFLSAGIEMLDENGKLVKRIYDVSTDFEHFDRFVKYLNDENITAEHLDGLIENYHSSHC